MVGFSFVTTACSCWCLLSWWFFYSNGCWLLLVASVMVWSSIVTADSGCWLMLVAIVMVGFSCVTAAGCCCWLAAAGGHCYGKVLLWWDLLL